MSFPFGQPLRIPVTVTDADPLSPTFGQLVDPGDVQLYLLAPGTQTPVEYTYSGAQLVRQAKGTYYLNFTPADTGQYGYWSETLNPFQGASVTEYFVVDARP
ncbi:MAG: hypothetical protein ACYCQK_02035 [Acidiferrobacteraceae bacterium]